MAIVDGMTRPHIFWDKLKASGTLVSGLFRDEVVAKVEIDTPIGSGFLECQLRQRKTGERYFILKAQGGEATVFVPLDQASARELVGFMQRSMLELPDNKL